MHERRTLRSPVIPELIALIVPLFLVKAVSANELTDASIWWIGSFVLVAGLWPRVLLDTPKA
jgi:hypothetical protein